MVINGNSIRWKEPEPIEVNEDLRGIIPGYEIFGELLTLRGIKTREQALAYLDPDKYEPSDPFDFPNMRAGIQIVQKALAQNRRIGIWGDFDADGQTATAILFEGLSKLTANLTYRIPVREKESHGLNLHAVEQLWREGVDVLITCDTGISDVEAIQFANEKKMTTIVTDHHAPPENLPAAAALINSQMLSAEHPMHSLSGAGVAYQFIRALYQHTFPELDAEEFLDLAAIGLVADLVPLTGECRYMVQKGLVSLRETKRPGLLALYKIARITATKLTEETISFAIAPRLNSLGRIGDANPIIELLTTQDAEKSEKMMSSLEAKNASRKNETNAITGAAIAILEQNPKKLEEPAIILEKQKWRTGLIGVVASQLSELYNKPAMIISESNEQAARGSVRSVEGINIVEILAENAEYLIRFGGHPAAAGFAIEISQIPAFMNAFQNSLRRQVKDIRLEKELRIDARVPIEIASTTTFLEGLAKFAPFGPENPQPVFLASNVRLEKISVFGREKNHRRLALRTPSGTRHNATWWNSGSQPPPPPEIDLAYQIGASSYLGKNEVEITLQAFRSAQLDEQDEKPITSLQVIDRRGCKNPVQQVLEIIASEDGLIFFEGMPMGRDHLHGRDRFHLEPCAVLILYTIPPELRVLTQMLEQVKPRKIYVFAVPDELDIKVKLLRFLSGYLVSAIKEHEGRVNVQELAAASGHKEITIQKAIEFLANRTTLQIKAKNETEIALSNFGKPADNNLKLFRELDQLIEETRYFRQFLQRTDLNRFFQNLEIHKQ